MALNGLAATPVSALLAGLSPPHPARVAAADCPHFRAAALAAFPYDTPDGSSSSSPGPPLPPAVDWSHAMGPVKNQHVNNTPCGCCWSFASTGVMEGALGVAGAAAAAADGRPPPPAPSLSEQELIDCDRGPPFKDAGCDGGDFEGGIAFAVKAGGLTSEASYPYRGKDGRCHHKRARGGRVRGVVGFKHVPPKNEAALKAAVARGPVAVAVCCGDFIDDWHAYTGGLMRFGISKNASAAAGPPTLTQLAGCPKPLDHAVVVVGYGTERGAGPGGVDQPYWLIKNSWGEAWGEKGYFKLAAGLPTTGPLKKGAAGLLTMPGFPTVDAATAEKVEAEGDAGLEAAVQAALAVV